MLSQKLPAVPPLILGAGGFGRQLAAWLVGEECGDVQFLDDAAPDAIGKLEDYLSPAVRTLPRIAYVGLGNNALRCALLQKLRAAGYTTPAFISSRAAISRDAEIGDGCIVLPFAYIGAGAHLGEGCIINAGAIVDHNAALGAGVHAAPGAIIKAGASVPAYTKVDSGEIIRSPWEVP